MQTLTKTLTALGLVLAMGLASAPEVMAKGHDQGSTTDPGSNVGSETAGPAQGLGGISGEGRGPADTAAADSPADADGGGAGGSGEAGRE